MKILILDGGLGTTLEEDHSVNFTPSQPLWSSHLLLSSPSTLLTCHRSFAPVADILTTATYQISLPGLASTTTPQFPHGIRDTQSILSVLDTAVRLASEAIRIRGNANAGSVALSIGPYGACMRPSTEYTGLYDPAHDDLPSLTAWHAQRLALYSQIPDLEERVEYIAVETIPRRDEISAVRTALAGSVGFEGVKTWISCVYPNGVTLPDGSTPEDVVRASLDPGGGETPWGIGMNCTKVERLEELVGRYEAEIMRMRGEGLVGEWPALVLYPDGTRGETYNTETKAWEQDKKQDEHEHEHEHEAWEEQLAMVVRKAAKGRWAEIVVGGCCKASPAHISRLRACLARDLHVV